MRMLPTLALVAIFPVSAMAQSISPQTLKGNETACYDRCIQKKDAALCKSACGCMTEEMGKYWSAKTYEERSVRWSKNGKDAELNRMMNAMAWYCIDKASKASQ